MIKQPFKIGSIKKYDYRIGAIIGNKTTIGIECYINPGKKMRVFFSPQNPPISLDYLGQTGYITISAVVTASGAIRTTIQAQHPKLNIQQKPMAVDPLEFVITEK